MAALLSIFDGYSDFAECHWLYKFAQNAIDRVFTLVAAASGEDETKVKLMLYRAVVSHVAELQLEIYCGYEDQFPFNSTGPGQEEWSWPEVERLSGQIGINAQFFPFSALGMFGYTVGKTAGWSYSKRWQFLSDFMEKPLPPSVAQHFGSEYGCPLSTNRLRKVANVIASNCSLRLHNDSDRYQYAISDWLDDLEFLKAKYYDGMGLKFVPWPDPRS